MGFTDDSFPQFWQWATKQNCNNFIHMKQKLKYERKKKKKTCQLTTEFQHLFSFIEVNARRVFFVVVSFFIYSYHSSISDWLSWTHHNFRGQIFIICRQPAGPPSWWTLSIWLYVQTINFYRKTQLTQNRTYFSIIKPF